MNVGVYCETLDARTLAAPDVLSLLGSRRATLGHALRADERFDPDALARCLELGRRLREAGGRYALWPLVPKAQGYWVNERNLDAVDRLADALLEGCTRLGATPDLWVIDVETPWQQMERAFFPGRPAWRKAASAIRLAVSNRDPKRFARAAARLERIVGRLRAPGVPAAATVFPFLLADLATGGHALQDFLEMPVFPVRFDAWNVMFYNSYLPAAAPLIVPPDAAARALYEYMRLLADRVGSKAWVTLGSTWEGVLPGNAGKVFASPEALAPDVAAARAAGIETVWLYCLEGVLYSDQALTRRRPLAESERFLDVLTATPPAEPPPHPKWTRGRRLLERLVRDRRKSAYRWDEAGIPDIAGRP
jgi:hypothetical protein